MPSGQGLTDGTAISLGDNANITIGTDFASGGPTGTPTAVVEGNRVRDPFNSGPNVIEFNSHGTLTVGRDGAIFSGANATNGEAINVHGYGNTIINYGLIRSANDAAAIWFEDNQVSIDPNLRNKFDNYGTVERLGGGNVMGTQHPTGGGIIFSNHTGATVIGNLNFAGGNDTLEFFPNSVVQGDIDGGAGTNALVLNGEAGSEDELTGGVANFQTLTKEGEGRWELSGSLSATDFVSVSVNHGTLALTGNNSNFEGEVFVNTTGILEARAQSLPTNTDDLDNVQNNGLVRFTQPDNGTYVGQIVGNGAVEKTGAGVLTLSPVATAGIHTQVELVSMAERLPFRPTMRSAHQREIWHLIRAPCVSTVRSIWLQPER